MAETRKPVNDGLLDIGKELTCSICTEVLYQPLTLLDCLHSFCGSCVKEWFAWQAADASHNRRITSPYTCPSCRDTVRGTKTDWRVTTWLEGFLKANPDRAKSEEEREQLRKHYKPGEDVLPKVEVAPDEQDSEDERLMAEVRELSMADIDLEAARRRAERAARGARPRRRQDGGTATHSHNTSGHLRQAENHHIEHQSSLRGLLSASSPVDSQNVQEEILQSIHAEGLLDGIDIENLTAEQEEELTERIAEAYRRRQRRRDTSTPQDGRPQPSHHHQRHQDRTDGAAAHPIQPRARPPISRPHLFEQTSPEQARSHPRSTSQTSQRSNRSAELTDVPTLAAPTVRSATDLSELPITAETEVESRRVSNNAARSTTDPESRGMHAEIQRFRASSANTRAHSGGQRPSDHPLEALRQSSGQANNRPSSLPRTMDTLAVEQPVRLPSFKSAFASEPVAPVTATPQPPSINCTHCKRPDIQTNLHYHCPWCRNGTYNLCLSCYRDGQGCDHWYGFGYRTYARWRRDAPPEGYPPEHERPHVLVPRRYVEPRTESLTPLSSTASLTARDAKLEEGAFCESCFSSANDCYWSCQHCLEGAWGFCKSCVQQGRHCTHPLLSVAHISTLRQPDPSKTAFIPLPHLRQDSYALYPETTDCDICRRPIPLNTSRYHCYQCSNGDYDICMECYHGLMVAGKISHANGTSGWRRCPQGHRMAIVGYQDIPEEGQQRITVAEPVGGSRLKEDYGAAAPQLPPQYSNIGMHCLAAWSYFPKEDTTDELGFPKNAEIREVEDLNGDWYLGVYAGKVGLFPSNHVRRML